MTWAEHYEQQAAAWRETAKRFADQPEWAERCKAYAEAAERMAQREREEVRA